MSMDNGVSGPHGQAVPKLVVVEYKEGSDNATIQLLLLVELTALVKKWNTRTAILSLVMVSKGPVKFRSKTMLYYLFKI